MPLVVENGSGMPDAESYVSVAEFSDYAARMGHDAEEIVSADEARKEAMLRRATFYLDGTYGPRINGVIKNEDQALIFPQVGATFYDGRPIPENSVPILWKNAQCEVAILALQNVALFTNMPAGPRLKSKRIDVLGWEWFENSYDPPHFGWLDLLLAPLIGPPRTELFEIAKVTRA